MSEFILFRNEDLLPSAWRAAAAGHPVWMFNPGLLREGDGWLLAYRVVLGGDQRRRIALCRLDARFRVVPDSHVPLTDFVVLRPDRPYPDQAKVWFADPRLYRFGERLFVYWNSGWHEPHNCQFLQELNPVTLTPHGYPRELILKSGERQKLEKNWVFFAADPEAPGAERARLTNIRAIYSPASQVVLECSLEGDEDIVCAEVHRTPWVHADYPEKFGALRGGAPPVRRDGHYYSFCHSVCNSPDGYRYVPSVCRFSAAAPFAVTDAPVAPLPLPNPSGPTTFYPKLNPVTGEVLYPCGAAWTGTHWAISYGINDAWCALGLLTPAEVEETLGPVAAAPGGGEMPLQADPTGR